MIDEKTLIHLVDLIGCDYLFDVDESFYMKTRLAALLERLRLAEGVCERIEAGTPEEVNTAIALWHEAVKAVENVQKDFN